MIVLMVVMFLVLGLAGFILGIVSGEHVKWWGRSVEQHADLEHEIWASWMRWLFTVGREDEDGTVVLPKGVVERWKRQMDTPYDELSWEERQSDIAIAMRHIHLESRGDISREGGTDG